MFENLAQQIATTFEPFIQLFTDPGPASFVNFTFLPKYAPYFIDGVLNTLALSVVAVLLAVIPALLLALMRLSKTSLSTPSPGHTLQFSALPPCWSSYPSSISACFTPSKCPAFPSASSGWTCSSPLSSLWP